MQSSINTESPQDCEIVKNGARNKISVEAITPVKLNENIKIKLLVITKIPRTRLHLIRI